MPKGVPFAPGNCMNPGGRPKTLVELERQIRDAEGPHILDVLGRMREAAMGVLVQETDRHGEAHVFEKAPDSQAARLYLERVLGPARIAADDVSAMGDAQLDELLCTGLGITVEDLRAIRAAKALQGEALA